MHREFDRPGAVEKGAYLRQCFDVVVIHDGIHPSIMNRNQASSVSFRVRNTAPVQYHLVLDKANYILATGGMVHCLRILFPATSGIQ
jgi:hypothetical protein